MSKFLISLLSLIFLNLTQAFANNCDGVAMQRATARYKADVGTVQGSDGVQVSIESRLPAKKPFLNYIVAIFDNNEDGEYWTSFYFVMTKFEENKCSVLKVSPTQEAALKINSYYDFENGEDLDQPQDFILNRELIKKIQLDFRLFVNGDARFCYLGDAQWSASLVQAVLDIATGDCEILESKLQLQNTRIEHKGSYTEGSGDFDMPLNFAIEKCL